MARLLLDGHQVVESNDLDGSEVLELLPLYLDVLDAVHHLFLFSLRHDLL